MPGKPSYTYCEMLQCALGTHPTGHMTLAEIYAWLIEKFPYFTTASTDWKNSVRHNLSLNKTLFTHEARHSDNPGRGGFWKLNLAQMHQPVKPRERKRSTVRHEPYAAGKAPRRKSKLLPTPHPDVAGKTVPKLPPPRQVQLPQRHLDILIDDWELGTGVFQ
ncbi:fork head domain-containing protein [Powellomyces hirtus]|nr:fork head domain-containing protein [Powellomyces hirtus]